MEWQERNGNWILTPSQPIGIIHFLGGAFVATAPHITYRWLLEKLASQGYLIIATPFVNTLDHKGIALYVLNKFENLLQRLDNNTGLELKYLPIYGMGHSMGCKLHLLISSLFEVERAGNILISFNNYPLQKAIPFMDQIIPSITDNLKNNWKIDPNLQFEFTPSPEETKNIVSENYSTRRNLLVKFSNDNIDQTLTLQPILTELFPNMISTLTLEGNHLTPLAQDIEWEVGEVFTPFDAIGQWVKQSFSRDIYVLEKEVSRWLNPAQYSFSENL